jgi:hypothetical protein
MGAFAMITFLIIMLLLLLAVGGGGYWYLTRPSRVPPGHVGVVHRNIPGVHPSEKYEVRTRKSHGIQATVLRASTRYWLPRPLYTIEHYPAVRVPPGTIGVVNALIGEPTPPGAKRVTPPCNSFQDAAAFLTNGGQAGQQLDVLTAGTYSINPYVFEVLTVDNIGSGKYGLTADDLRELSVPVGRTGVVITLAGDAPSEDDGAVGRRVPGHENFQLASVFLANGGQRGAQEQTLSPGTVYQLNPWFARVELIPSREILLEWSSNKKPPGNFDASLGQIVITIGGNRIQFDMDQVIRIPPQAAPRLAGWFGEQEEDVYGASSAAGSTPVRRFVERVLSRVVEGYFMTTAADRTILDFFDQLEDVRLSLEDKVRESLAELGIEAVRTTLSNFRSEDRDLDELRQQIAFARDRRRILESGRENARIENEILVGRAEAEAIAGTAADIRLLQEQIQLLGRDQVAKERFLRQLTRMMVPQIVSGDATNLLHYMPLHQAIELISKASGGSPAQLVSAERAQLGPGGSASGTESPAGPDEPAGGAAGVSPAARRYLKGQCQESVPVGEPFSLLASIVLGGSGGAELKSFGVPSQGRDVLLVVHAPELRLLGRQRMTVHVPADRDSEPVMFELRADEPGPRAVSVTAWLGGSYLGELLVEITAERGRPPGLHRDELVQIPMMPADGAVSLVVRYDPVQNAYRFEFRDEDNPDEVTSNLAYEPGPLVEQLVAELDGIARARSGYSAAQARDYLVNAGARLWQELVPERLRQQFWERQHRIRHLTILADRDAVPWELLYPMDPGHDAGFLVEQFPVTRAIFGHRPARRLSLQPARFVLPDGSPPEAREEIEVLRGLLDPAQPAGAVISELTPLQDLIGSGDFGVLHFACHNTYDPAAGSSIMLDSRFTPTLMTTAVIGEVLARSAPVVFINACRSAGLAATYNRLDGWASKFLEAGAAAFIGSLWAVSDETARGFAGEFYSHLKAGASLGKAAMLARQAAASQSGDPTWLAYTVYGDPRAMTSGPQA